MKRRGCAQGLIAMLLLQRNGTILKKVPNLGFCLLPTVPNFQHVE
jgi:hypothetical protein